MHTISHPCKTSHRALSQGFSLLELILVLSVMAGLSSLGFQAITKRQEATQAENAGKQIAIISQAVNKYIALRYNVITYRPAPPAPPPPFGVNDTGPRTCTYPTPTATVPTFCTISIDTLVKEHLLPSNFKSTTTNPFNSPYAIRLQIAGAPPNLSVNGMVITVNGWTIDGKIRQDLLGTAMSIAGPDAGVTTNTPPMVANTLYGYNGAWSEKNVDWNGIINTNGQLGMVSGYNSSLYSAFLPRNGSLPMTGTLSMGTDGVQNNDIRQVKNLTVVGDTSNPSTIGVATTGVITASTTGVITAPALSVDAIRSTDPTKTIDMLGTRIKVDDVFITSRGQWLSNLEPSYSSRGAFIGTNGLVVSKPDCTAAGNIALGSSLTDVVGQTNGVPRIIVTPAISFVGGVGITGVVNPSATTWPTYPASIGGPGGGQLYGIAITRAVDNAPVLTWTIENYTLDSTNPTVRKIIPGNKVIIQTFCDYMF